MRIGVMFDTERPFDEVVAQVAGLRDAGIETAWASQIFAYDALTAIAAVGREVPGIEFGTAVVPTYPRHPVMLAAQALTVQAATGGRLTLGIGLSHQLVIENVFGQSFDKPARHMREYLSILMPLLEGEQASFVGETLSASTFGPLQIDAPAPPVLVAALGTTMLQHRRPAGHGHGHLDDRAGHHRVPHRPHDPVGRHRGRTARAAHRGGPAGLRHRRRRRGPGQGRRALRHLRHPALVPGHARPRGGRGPGRCGHRGHRVRGAGPDPPSGRHRDDRVLWGPVRFARRGPGHGRHPGRPGGLR